jgi:hypothetical protein
MWTSIKTFFAGILGAAFVGASTAAGQQVMTGNWDGHAAGAAAAGGAIAGAVGYLIKSPRQIEVS